MNIPVQKSSLKELSTRAHTHAKNRSRPSVKNEIWRNVRLSDLEKEFVSSQAHTQAQTATAVSAPESLPYGNDNCIVINNGQSDHALLNTLSEAEAWHEQLVENDDLSSQWLLTQTPQHYSIDINSDQQLCIYNYADAHNGHSACTISLRIARNVRCDIILIHNVHSGARSSIAIHCDAAADSVTRIDECESSHDSLQQGQILRHASMSLAGNAQLTWTQCQISSDLNRSSYYVDLNGPHAHVDLSSATICNGDHQAHQYIRVNHAQADTSSKQTFKCIATDNARFSFDGLIHIAEGADGSSAEQINANLQLSDTCRVHSRPQLDIDTDDVIATHGSASGQISEEEILYLRSRGISEKNARTLITKGFLLEVIHNFHSDYARELSSTLLNTNVL